MKKTGFFRKIGLTLIASLVLATAAPGFSAFMPETGLLSTVEAATKTITVKKADASTAKAVNKVLISGKALNLKVKGNKANSKKLIKNLQKKIKTTNKDGVIFQYEAVGASGSYYKYKITSENAKIYMYSVKFTDKLFKNFKNGKCKNVSVVYTGQSLGSFNGVNEYAAYYELYKWYKDSGASGSMWNFAGSVLKTYKNNSYSLYSSNPTRYTIFACLQNGYITKDVCNAYEKAFKAKTFASLSDAMKIFLIAKSGYFACNYKNYSGGRNGYCMVYDYYDRKVISEDWWSSISGKYTVQKMKYSRAMKYLYDNQASGVCEDYSNFELLYFKQLGLSVWKSTNSNINHAWTVLKVKNSKGKALWIPFDYGIGPSNSLAVSDAVKQKYLSTEAKRYKTYLSGVSGAPSKKNFKNSDFN